MGDLRAIAYSTCGALQAGGWRARAMGFREWPDAVRPGRVSDKGRGRHVPVGSMQ